MCKSISRWICGWGVSAVVCLLLVSRPATAAEPAQEFLEGLRARGYYDIAVVYLNKVKDSPLVTPSFKRTIDYEMGLTLVQSAQFMRDPEERAKTLDQAEAALQRFVDTQKTHTYYWAGKNQLANLLVERARMSLERANRPTTPENEKEQLTQTAREKYNEALTTFQSTRQELKGRLEQIRPDLDPDNPSDKPLIEIRDRYRMDYLQARLLIPAVIEELADTLSAEEARKEKLLEAAKEYDDVYTDYRTRIAGLYARMYQGRCYKKMGDYKEALSFFDDLLENPNEPEAFKALKLKVLTEAVEIWLQPEQNMYSVAIEQLEDVFKVVNPGEERQPEWLYLRLKLAEAYVAFAEDLEKKESKTAEDRRQIQISKRQAAQEATFVARIESDYKRPAQELLAKLRDVQIEEEKKDPPKTFAEAQQAGREALDKVNTAEVVLKQLRADLANAQDEQEKAEIQQAIDEQITIIQEGPGKAMDYFRSAIALADEDTSPRDINLVRYFLCYLYWSRQEFYKAALMGEFLCRRYPDAPGAKQSAKIALASYLNVRQEQIARAQDKQVSPDTRFADQRMVSIADYILEKWKGSDEAIEAANTLIVMMIKQNKLDKALEYLETVPVESPQRGQIELTIGTALWGGYLNGMSKVRQWEADPESVPEGKSGEEEKAMLQRLKETAEQVLVSGVERMRQSDVNPVLVTAALYLAQIYVDTGETDKALELLEDKSIGPYSLVKQKHPATQREHFEIDTCKVALRAYITKLKSGDAQTKAAAKEKAEEVMNHLKAVMGEERKSELVGIFVGVASDLKRQMESLASLSEKEAFADALAGFLEDVQQGSADLEIRVWVANTYSQTGEIFSTGGMATPKARPYYEKAKDAFQELLELPSLTDPRQRLQVRMKVAETYRALGPFPQPSGQKPYFEQAIDTLVEILKENNMLLSVQMEAAKTYQQWANHTNDLKRYVYAIQGSHLDERSTVNGEPNKNQGKNIIWGFGRMGQIAFRGVELAEAELEKIDLESSREELAEIRQAIADTQDNQRLGDAVKEERLRGLMIQEQELQNRIADLQTRAAELQPQIEALNQRIDNLMNVFLEARYHLAECRLGFAELKKDKKEYERTLRDIQTTATVSNNFQGYDSWKAKFESLKRKVPTV